MSVSEAQKRATAKYEKEKYDKILVRFPKGTKDRIKEKGCSLNSFISDAVIEKLDKYDGNNEPQSEIKKEKEEQTKFTDRLDKEALELLYKEYGKEKIMSVTGQLEIIEKYGTTVLQQLAEYDKAHTTETKE